MTGPAAFEAAARAIVAALGVGIIEAGCLAALVFGVTRLSRPSATTRHVLWWIVLAAAVALPCTSIFTSLGRIEHLVAATATAARDANRAADGGATTARVWTNAQIATAGPPASESAIGAGFARVAETATALGSSAAAIPHAAVALLVVWLAGAGVGLAQLGRGLVALAAIKRAAVPLDEAVVRRLRRWRHSTRLGREATLRVSNAVDVPVAVGFRNPTILFPARIVETEEIADLDQIAMHEYAHLNRYDDWTNLVQRAIERTFWFNPAVFFVGRQIALDREIACDDWVVAQTGRAHRYATCLWKLVESARLPANPILAPGALLSPKQITTRIEQLLDSRRNALPRLSPIGALALGSLGVALIVLQAQRAPVIAIEDLPAATAVAPASAVAQAPAAARAAAKRVAPVAVRVAVRAAAPAAAVTPMPAFVRATVRASAAQRAADAADAVDSHVKATIDRHVKAALDEHVGPLVAAAAEAGAAAGAEASAAAGYDRWNDSTKPATLSRATIAHCFGCDLRGRDLRGLDLHGIALNGADLRGADLRGVDVSGAKFFGVDLRDAKLDAANLSHAHLTGCDLRGASLANANLDGTEFVGTNVRNVTLDGTHLRSIVDHCMGCDLRGADLHGQDLHGIDLVGADMSGADLRGANLSGARLSGVNLRGAHVEGANFTGAVLTGCQLDGLDIQGAKIQGFVNDLARVSVTVRRTCPLRRVLEP